MPTYDVDIPFGRWATQEQRAACVSDVVGRISGMAIASRLSPQGATGFTVDDIQEFPNDGLRYELIDGMLIVNPPPTKLHQLALTRLYALLIAGAPPGIEVFPAPTAWRPDADENWYEPDLIVTPTPTPEVLATPGVNYFDVPPMLVVEILSPSTRTYDVTAKYSAYDRGGAAAYWIVDPAVGAPTVDVFERTESGGSLTSVGHAEGEERLEISVPWPVTVVPADLVR
ncbi:MAG: Uma2 family endonuclease [Acidimicrobiales bacterium]|nr:Uma2 family endonuclease [Acidimicrobiales bacterium]